MGCATGRKKVPRGGSRTASAELYKEIYKQTYKELETQTIAKKTSHQHKDEAAQKMPAIRPTTPPPSKTTLTHPTTCHRKKMPPQIGRHSCQKKHPHPWTPVGHLSRHQSGRMRTDTTTQRDSPSLWGTLVSIHKQPQPFAPTPSKRATNKTTATKVAQPNATHFQAPSANNGQLVMQ